MSVKVANNRFMVFSLAGFYQQILNGLLSFQELGNMTVKKAEAAFYLRQVDILKELGSILSSLPIKEYQLISQYYLSWCEYYKGANEPRTFENVLEGSVNYRPKALMSLAAIKARIGDYASEAYYFTKAKESAESITTLIKASKGIAVVKAREGFHTLALKDLESILPLIKHADPFVYYDYLNSYAVELGEAGRVEEAQNVCRITLASPYAFAYPEWRETEQELALQGYKSRSSVRVKLPGNLLYLPEREASDKPVIQEERARVFSLEEWKEEKMAKEPNGDDEKDLDEMNDKDLFMEIMRVASQDFITSEKLRKMVESIKKIASEKN